MSENRKSIFEHITYFDPVSGKFKENQIAVVENGKFIHLGDDGSYDVSSTDTSYDLSNKFVIPGLIDCHVHLGSQMPIDYERQLLRTNSGMYYYIALKHAQKHLSSGFTTVRDCGSRVLWGPSLRQTFDEKSFIGPRLVLANRPISQWGNQEARGPDDFKETERKYMTQSGPYGVMHAVRERKRSGSNFIKTMTSGGVLHGQESDLSRALWTKEELTTMVTEANRLGMHVSVHAHGQGGIHLAAECGVQSIEHCSLVTEEAADLMVKNNVYLVPTQASIFTDKPDVMAGIPPEVREKTIEVDTKMIDHHKMAFDKGVRIALGTDAGTPGNIHGKSAWEMTSYVQKMGIDEVDALRSGTILAAEAIRKDHQIGSIAINKYADFVVVDENPLNDITILEDLTKLSHVFKDGDLVARYGKFV